MLRFFISALSPLSGQLRVNYLWYFLFLNISFVIFISAETSDFSSLFYFLFRLNNFKLTYTQEQ